MAVSSNDTSSLEGVGEFLMPASLTEAFAVEGRVSRPRLIQRNARPSRWVHRCRLRSCRWKYHGPSCPAPLEDLDFALSNSTVKTAGHLGWELASPCQNSSGLDVGPALPILIARVHIGYTLETQDNL